jgi:hypothetical protein
MIGSRWVVFVALFPQPQAGFVHALAAHQAVGESTDEPADQTGGPSRPVVRPITESIDTAVEAYLRERNDPCARADSEGTACFPEFVEGSGTAFSVAESLRNWKPDGTRGAEAKVPVTQLDTPVAGVTFDPICAGQSLWKALRGRNDTYYLYRVWNHTGEYALLREQPMLNGDYSEALLGYVLVDTIKGECRALSAWRKANREAIERNGSGPHPQ